MGNTAFCPQDRGFNGDDDDDDLINRTNLHFDFNSDWPQQEGNQEAHDRVLFDENDLVTNPCTRNDNQQVMTSLGLELNATIIVPMMEEEEEEEGEVRSDATASATTIRAYMIERDIRDAQYGPVYVVRELRRFNTEHTPSTGLIWETTNKLYAIKEMSLEQISSRCRTIVSQGGENPIQEILAMQALKRLHEEKIRKQARQEAREEGEGEGQRTNANLSTEELRERYEATIFDTNVMMPIDVLIDGRNLYCVMPFCDGQDLVDYLENEDLTEEDGRVLMKQILNGIHTLQKAEICHRDISLENIVIDRTGFKAIICDFGMCSKIPHLQRDDQEHNDEQQQQPRRQRCMINYNGTYGKAAYMSPEIMSGENYDGHAVDLWCVAVVFFMAIAGVTPWESQTDRVFRIVTSGNFRAMIPHWRIDLSKELADLFQRMFHYDACNRLSLEQIKAHPWLNVQQSS